MWWTVSATGNGELDWTRTELELFISAPVSGRTYQLIGLAFGFDHLSDAVFH